MAMVRGSASACAIVLAFVALLAVPASAGAATPFEIFSDYVVNGGVITGDYSFEDLKGALEEAQEDALYPDFADAVANELDAEILGRSQDAGDGILGGVGPESELTLPEPRTPDQSGDPPWPLLALTVLAAALVVTGAGSSIYRRARR